MREATELTLARTPPNADLKVLLVDLDDTLFFRGMGRFLDTKFLINKAIVQKIVNQQGFQTFEAFAINARNVFKTPSLSEKSDTSSRVVVSPHTNHFKNPLFYNTRETMEDGICEQLKRLHDEGGYQIVGLTSRSPVAVMQDYTHACLKDAKISFHNLHCFASAGIELQSDNDGFTFSNGIIFCGPRDKARQASLFLAHNLHLKYINPVESLHLVYWDDQKEVIKRAMKDGNYTERGIAKKVSKHGICMGLEPLLEKSLESKDWEPKAAAALFLNLLLQNPEIRASSATK